MQQAVVVTVAVTLPDLASALVGRVRVEHGKRPRAEHEQIPGLRGLEGVREGRRGIGGVHEHARRVVRVHGDRVGRQRDDLGPRDPGGDPHVLARDG